MTDKLANASENETEDGQTLAELLEAYLDGEGTFNTDIHRGDVVDGTVVSVDKERPTGRYRHEVGGDRFFPGSQPSRP